MKPLKRDKRITTIRYPSTEAIPTLALLLIDAETIAEAIDSPGLAKTPRINADALLKIMD